MRYVCLTEPGDWQTYVISGKAEQYLLSDNNFKIQYF
jgi:hypothetical protein